MWKRLFDLLAASILLFLTVPIGLLIALAIRLTDKGPIFFTQTRAGLLGRPFGLLKFRSMKLNSLPLDDVTEIRESHPLVTPVGRWIRRYKIDELPQLINVLRGDMSLIGPRPALVEHLANFTEFQRRRLNVLPGLTGWAQVTGGIEISWSERITLDVWYVGHRSCWLGLKILWRTVSVVLFGDMPDREALAEALEYATQIGCRGMAPHRSASATLNHVVPTQS